MSFAGLMVPFAVGFAAAYLFPRFLGAESNASRLIFALFVGTALSISALPVIAKILMDLDVLRTNFGLVVICSAMFDDLVGWILFGVVLGMMGTSARKKTFRLTLTSSPAKYATCWTAPKTMKRGAPA